MKGRWLDILLISSFLASFVTAGHYDGGIRDTSRNGKCGRDVGWSCKGSYSGDCCSQYGWGGSSDDYCGNGCQDGYGERKSGATSPSNGKKVSPNGQCGERKGYTCQNSYSGSCCSEYGWCGSSNDYCGKGCQSAFGKCKSPVKSSTSSSRKASAISSSRKPSSSSSSRKATTTTSLPKSSKSSSILASSSSSKFSSKSASTAPSSSSSAFPSSSISESSSSSLSSFNILSTSSSPSSSSTIPASSSTTTSTSGSAIISSSYSSILPSSISVTPSSSSSSATCSPSLSAGSRFQLRVTNGQYKDQFLTEFLGNNIQGYYSLSTTKVPQSATYFIFYGSTICDDVFR